MDQGSTERRAEYARLLSACFEAHGGTLKDVAAQLGVTPEAFRQNKAGLTVPATRAKVRAQDQLFRTGGELERALYGPQATPVVKSPDRTDMLEVLGAVQSELRELRAEVADLRAAVEQPTAAPAVKRPRSAGRKSRSTSARQ